MQLQAMHGPGRGPDNGFTESMMCELAHEKSKVKLCMVQLPGLNTSQFDWNLSKMPGHPMPVPPVFQPELPARAIAYLAEHPRRNMWVGLSTAYTILGERLAPKLLDWYLGRSGVKSPQTDRTCRGWDRTCSNPVTRPRTRARTARSTTRPTPPTRCCGCPPTAAPC
jgi:hypothetical protein